MKLKPQQTLRRRRPVNGPNHQLSTREREIAHLAAQNQAAQDIAGELGLHTASVNPYCRRIFAKPNVHKRVAAVARVQGPDPVTSTGYTTRDDERARTPR